METQGYPMTATGTDGRKWLVVGWRWSAVSKGYVPIGIEAGKAVPGPVAVELRGTFSFEWGQA